MISEIWSNLENNFMNTQINKEGEMQERDFEKHISLQKLETVCRMADEPLESR